MAYNDVVEGDQISAEWMNAMEDAHGGKSIFGTSVYPAQPATYTVFKSGSYYCARNGLTGKIDFDDTTWETLMNETILDMYDSAAGTGGTICLKGPVHTCTGQVNMRPGISVKGDGIAGKLAAALTGVWPLGTTIEAPTDVTVFSFDYPTPTTAHYFNGISNLHIVGADYDVGAGTSTKPLIDLQCNSNYLSDVFLRDLYTEYGKYGIRILNGAAATYKIWNIWIDHCLPENNNANGIMIDSTNNQIIERVRIKDCHFYNNCLSSGNGGLEINGHATYCSHVGPNNTFDTEYKHSIYLDDEANNWVIHNNVIKEGGNAAAGTYSGIYLNDVDYITTTGNNVANVTTANLKYGFYTDDNSTYSTPHSNTFKAATAGMYIGVGAGMRYDFVTNNSWPR